MPTLIDSARDLTSIGTLAARVNQTVRAIERAADQLNIRATWRINGVEHFDGDQVELLTAHFRGANAQ